MTPAEALFEPTPDHEQQWRLEAILLCNWGGFGGVHEIGVQGLDVLLSGVSGAGKSTVLDAWTTLLTPTASLNAASNEAGARTRGEGIRTTLTYVRGTYGFAERRDVEVPLVLRGVRRPGPLDTDPQDTWSAIAAVFVSTTGIRHSFLRTFFAPREAVNPGDMKTQYAVFAGRLDTQHITGYLEPAALGSELSKPALERLPGLTVLQATSYSDELKRRLGIGAHGEGDKALRLLADLQRGRPVQRVSRLFQDLVLERPITYEKADKVVKSFAGLDTMHTQMKDAEDQLSVLEGLDVDHAAMTEAIAAITRIDTLGISRSGRTPFTYWSRHYKAGLVEEERVVAAEEHEMAVTLQAELERSAAAVKRYLDNVWREYLGSGGADIDQVEAELLHVKETLDRVEDDRRRLGDAIRAVRSGVPETAEDFARAQQEARRFLAGHAAARDELRGRSASVQRASWKLHDRIADAEQEIARLERATGNISGALVAVRDRFAVAAGLAADELPFVGELLDMHDQWEHWRAAADAELSGFANTVLIDERVQGRFQQAINDLSDLRRRLAFRAVPVDLPVGPAAPDRTLAGRLVVKDGAFAGWLRAHVDRTYPLVCVETAAEFTDDDAPQISRTGQTKRGRRGAHGSGGRVIGFSNVARRAELSADIATWRADLAPLEGQLGDLERAAAALADQHEAYRQVAGARWADLDVTGIRARVAVEQERRDRLVRDKDLHALKREVEELEAEHAEASELHFRQTVAVEAAQERRKKVDDDAAELARILDEWVDDPAVKATAEQMEELQTRLGQLDDQDWAGGLADFDHAVSTLRASLSRDLEASTVRRDAAAGRIVSRCREYQANPAWRSDSRGVTLADYDDYLAILVDLRSRGLHAQRRRWARAVIEWSGEDLSELIQSYRRAEDDIEDRLGPIRAILASIPFGRAGDPLDLEAVSRRPAPLLAFLKDLRVLAGGAMTPEATDEQVTEKFVAIRAAVERITVGSPERDMLLDVRRHLTVRARSGVRVYDHLGDQSGGEGQMITAFIVGSALRYRLGDEKRNRPRFAPVVLDEAFIKADSEYTATAVAAWKQLGFQLIVGAPEEKVNSLEAALDLSIVITKNPEHYSYASLVARKAGPAS